MKKISLLAAAAIVAAGMMTSCDSTTSKPTMKTNIDTLSYVLESIS